MTILLNKKRFPIKLDPEQATEIIKKNLKKKGHKIEIKKSYLYLTITPYWIAFYDILINKEGSFSKVSGQIGLNGVNNQVNEKVIEVFKYAKPIIKEKVEAPKTEAIQIVLKKSIITQEEAEKTLLKYLSYKHNVKQEQISLSGVEEIFVPNWKLRIDNFKIKIDAIKGKVNNFDDIPYKQKTKGELVKEVFEDIKEGKNIGEYFKNIFKSIYLGISFVLRGVVKNYKVILWIVLIALLIYLIFL